MNSGAISEQIWEAIRAEFTLPSLEQVRVRLAGLMEDPDPMMQQLIRVFIGDGTFCPGFQFTDRGQLHPTATGLFRHAMSLQIPHNYFTVWMVTPASDLNGARPVDSLDREQQLHHVLKEFTQPLTGDRRAN